MMSHPLTMIIQPIPNIKNPMLFILLVYAGNLDDSIGKSLVYSFSRF